MSVDPSFSTVDDVVDAIMGDRGRRLLLLTDFDGTLCEFQTDPATATTLINVDSFNDSSIDIMFYCFTKTTNWGDWMVIKEALAYKVKEIVEQAGTGFAFPSSSLYVEKMPFGRPEAYPGTDRQKIETASE